MTTVDLGPLIIGGGSLIGVFVFILERMARAFFKRYDELDKQNSVLSATLQTLQESVEAIKKDQSITKQELQTERERRITAEAARDIALKRADSLEKDVNSLREDLAVANKKIEELTAEVAAMRTGEHPSI